MNKIVTNPMKMTLLFAFACHVRYLLSDEEEICSVSIRKLEYSHT